MTNSNDQSFIVDSDATSHMTNDVGKLLILNHIMIIILFMLEMEIVYLFLILEMFVFL